MRFQKSIAALFVGALVLGPTTGAFADDTPDQSVTGAGALSVQAETPELQAPPSDVPVDPEAGADAPATDPEAPKSEERPEKQATAPASTSVPPAETKPESPADEQDPAAAPVQAAVTITGAKGSIAAVGEKLVAQVKIPAELEAASYSWTAADAPVSTDPQYTVKSADAGKTLKVKVSLKTKGDAALDASADAAPVAVDAVIKAKAQAKVSATAKISGTAKVGKKLVAKTTTVKAPKGVKVSKSYTWYANGKKIATGTKYTVKKNVYKKRITVRAKLSWKANTTYFAGSTNSKTAKKTAAVKKQTAKVTSKMRVTGWAKPGKRLNASVTVKKPKALKVKTSYTWYVSGKRYKTGKSLKINQSMVGRKISVIQRTKWSGGGTYTAGSVRNKNSYRGFSDRPAKMVRSARAQIGDYQDCTVLIERALRFSGIKAGDLGTRASEYTALGGKRVSSAQPGDVFIWEGRHVAMYIGSGKAIHSGYAGNQTVVASAYLDGSPNAIVRFK